MRITTIAVCVIATITGCVTEPDLASVESREDTMKVTVMHLQLIDIASMDLTQTCQFYVS